MKIVSWTKQVLVDLVWVYCNLVVNKIPIAFLRKFLYTLVGLRIGAGSRIGVGTVIIQPWKIRIGKNTVINEFCYLDGRGGLQIGDRVSISIYAKILTASHRVNSSTFERYKGPVVIHNQVWIGMAAVILDGSTLHESCVIGANGAFKGDAVAKGIYIGNPASILRQRTVEYVDVSDFSFFK